MQSLEQERASRPQRTVRLCLLLLPSLKLNCLTLQPLVWKLDGFCSRILCLSMKDAIRV